MPLPNSPGEAVQPVSTPSPGPTTQSKLRVLIVDDDSSMARFLTSHLSRRGFEINIANNGEEAIRMFRVFDPNLVLQLQHAELCLPVFELGAHLVGLRTAVAQRDIELHPDPIVWIVVGK